MTEKIYIRKDRWVDADGVPHTWPWVVGPGRPSYDATGLDDDSEYFTYVFRTHQIALHFALTGEDIGD